MEGKLRKNAGIAVAFGAGNIGSIPVLAANSLTYRKGKYMFWFLAVLIVVIALAYYVKGSQLIADVKSVITWILSKINTGSKSE